MLIRKLSQLREQEPELAQLLVDQVRGARLSPGWPLPTVEVGGCSLVFAF